jgi:hypothetical protein
LEIYLTYVAVAFIWLNPNHECPGRAAPRSDGWRETTTPWVSLAIFNYPARIHDIGDEFHKLRIDGSFKLLYLRIGFSNLAFSRINPVFILIYLRPSISIVNAGEEDGRGYRNHGNGDSANIGDERSCERWRIASLRCGTMMVPAVGVLASLAMLHEPFAVREIAALTVMLAGVVLATRS